MNNAKQNRGFLERATQLCLKKKKIRTEKIAKKISKEYLQYYYFCPVCFNYHLTSKGHEDSNSEIVKYKNW